MNQRLPRVNADEIIHVLSRLGFELVRQSGSHRIFRNLAGKRVTVPYHRGRVLHPKVFASILKDAGLSVDEFERLR